jgi:putative component of toxin-antitoxin plasmid stabilization module
VYYTIAGHKLILLLAGSDKKDQNRAIKRAKQYMADYERRTGR